MLNITLPDGSVRQYESPVTVAQIAASIGAGLAKATVAGKVNGKLVDACDPITEDAHVQIITPKDKEAWKLSATPARTWLVMRSSSSTLMPKWLSARSLKTGSITILRLKNHLRLMIWPLSKRA